MNIKREECMAISSSASPFDESDNIFKALKKLTLNAETRKEAEFLAKLYSCIRRGQPDKRLIEIVDLINKD